MTSAIAVVEGIGEPGMWLLAPVVALQRVPSLGEAEVPLPGL
jgi:hypothetical protein